MAVGFLGVKLTVAEAIYRCANSSLPVVWLRRGPVSQGAGTLSDLLQSSTCTVT